MKVVEEVLHDVSFFKNCDKKMIWRMVDDVSIIIWGINVFNIRFFSLKLTHHPKISIMKFQKRSVKSHSDI